MKEDLMKGDQAKKELVELQKSFSQQKNENQNLKQNIGILNAEIGTYGTCLDSLEKKNALISNYHMHLAKAKKTSKFLTGFLIALAVAFALK